MRLLRWVELVTADNQSAIARVIQGDFSAIGGEPIQSIDLTASLTSEDDTEVEEQQKPRRKKGVKKQKVVTKKKKSPPPSPVLAPSAPSKRVRFQVEDDEKEEEPREEKHDKRAAKLATREEALRKREAELVEREQKKDAELTEREKIVAQHEQRIRDEDAKRMVEETSRLTALFEARMGPLMATVKTIQTDVAGMHGNSMKQATTVMTRMDQLCNTVQNHCTSALGEHFATTKQYYLFAFIFS